MKTLNLSLIAVAILLINGCSQKSPKCPKCPDITHYSLEIQDLQAQNNLLKKDVEKYKKLANENFPHNATVGKCYARVLMPSPYRYEEKRIKISGKTEDIITTPPKYEWVTKKILVKEASEKLVPTPAVYDTVTEKVLAIKAHKEWKKFTKEECMKDPLKCGLKSSKNLDAYTGEIICLVNVPDIYKTVTKKILKKPAGVKKIIIPAVYKTVKVKKLIEPAKSKKITYPAQFETVKTRIKDGKEKLVWEEIVCLKFIDEDFTRQLQEALKAKGYYNDKIDGIYGKLTKQAIIEYQKDHSLSTGALTIKTLNSLGLKIDHNK